MPDGPTTVTCDPVKQSGCARVEDACFVFARGEQACLLYGKGVANQSACDVHSDCMKGSGCFDSLAGRFCRGYCDLRNPACGQAAPVCSNLGGGQWGICLPSTETSDAAAQL
jgi:hypothetical protein